MSAQRDGLRILVLEDQKQTREAIADYLGERLHRLACCSPNHPHSTGALAHLLPPGWGPYRRAHFDVASANEDDIKELIEPHLPNEMLVAKVKQICKREFLDHDRLDILVVDLALAKKQQDVLNGQDLPDSELPEQPRINLVPAVPDPQGRFEDIPVEFDIRPVLETLTGFRVLQAHFRQPYRAIATTYAKNPIIRQHCFANGAYDVVLKPVPAEEMSYIIEAGGIDEVERLAEDGRDLKAVAINLYLKDLAAEVLKAAVLLSNIKMEARGLSTDIIRHRDLGRSSSRALTAIRHALRLRRAPR